MLYPDSTIASDGLEVLVRPGFAVSLSPLAVSMDGRKPEEGHE